MSDKNMQMTPLSAIQGFAGCRILVLGDVMLDRYIYGQTNRISPEAPVPVLSVEKEIMMPGGAANVARNIASLGGQVTLMGGAGDDAGAGLLESELSEIPGITPALTRVPGRPTTTKIRVVAEAQQIVRVDREVKTDLPAEAETELLAAYEKALAGVDLVILSDYAKGVLTARVTKEAIRLARAAAKPVIVDPKTMDPARYDGATLLTPNLSEARQMSGLAGKDDAAVAAMAEKIFAAAPHLSSLVITRSGDGMSIARRGGQMQHFSITAREIADVSGAGDTVIATLGLALAAHADLATAAALSNTAAGIVVGKTGTAEVYPAELIAALQKKEIGVMTAKTATAAEAAKLAAEWRRQGLKVGFTNGCFDLIHPGHISLLRQAKAPCDKLIVGLNTDASIKRLKGESRPVQSEAARAIVLGAISAVDLVVLFGEDTPIDLISAIKPDILVKGADYTVETVVGADFVQSYGGRVVLAQLTPNQSTSGIISRIDHK